MSWRKEYDKYMDKVAMKRKAFNEEMIPKFLGFLQEKYGTYRVQDGYVYIVLGTVTITEFLEAISPYITHNEVAIVKGEVRVSLRFA